MAPLPSLVLISACLCMSHTALAVNVVANDKDTILIRREVAPVDSDPNGKTKVALKEFQKKAQETTQDITECDRQFVLMADGSDECAGSPFLQMTDSICQFAAKELSGVAVSQNTTGYFLNNTDSATLDHPADCFYDATAGTFHYNPLGSHSTNTLTGRKLCLRASYIDGTVDTDSTGGCSTPAVPILTAKECFEAAACAGGGEVCRMDSFQENETATERWKAELGEGVWQHVPKGCFKMPATHLKAGCWNFSPNAPDGAVSGGFSPVCKNVVASENEYPGR